MQFAIQHGKLFIIIFTHFHEGSLRTIIQGNGEDAETISGL